MKFSLDNSVLKDQNINVPTLKTEGGQNIENAYGVALHVLLNDNCVIKNGKSVMRAGGCYNDVWTRDGSYNSYMAGNLICPQTAENTMLFLTNITGKDYIAGTLNPGEVLKYDQFWDKMIWTTAAFDYYLLSGDVDFLKKAYVSSKNTFIDVEKRIDADFGLLCGPAFMCDGVGSLPATICDEEVREKGSSCVMDYERSMQVMVLSSNCILYNAYVLMCKMEKILGIINTEYMSKAEQLKANINKYLWNEKRGTYDFFKYGFGELYGKNDEHQESAGLAFAVLFDVADEYKRKSVFENIHVENYGVPLSWPSMENKYIGNGKFRDDATGYDIPQNIAIWPNINGLWARACAKYNSVQLFSYELNALTKLINNSDNTVYEIYHANTGEIGLKYYQKKHSQTWAATAYLSMIYYGVFGILVNENGISFSPNIPDDLTGATLNGVVIRGKKFNINIQGNGADIKEMYCNGKRVNEILYVDDVDTYNIEIHL